MAEDVVSIDFESRSRVDIKLGLERYTGCPECEPLMLAFDSPGSDEVRVWHRGFDLKQPEVNADALERLLDHVAMGGLVAAFNAMFEWYMWNKVCVPKLGWPELRLEQLRDTMARAAAQNLPQALGKCADVLGLPADAQKSKRGKHLIQRLCVPHKPTKTREGVWVQDPALFAEFVDYCAQDVRAEKGVARKLRPLTAFEQQVWEMTQKINLRGVPVDLVETTSIRNIVEQEKNRLNAELRQLTGRQVEKASGRDKLLRWVNARLVEPVDFEDPVDQDEDRPGHEELLNMRAKTVEDALARGDLPADVRRALEIRAAVVQTSTAKYDKMLKIVADDGTVKNLFVYHGAGPGRWASRGGLNVQNFARPTLDDVDIHSAFESLPGGHQAWLALLGDQTMDAAVSCLRGVIHAPPGYDFIDADYSSVENRMGVWLAGQWDKVGMFAKGFDEYKVFASKSLYNVPYDMVTKDMRQMSKSAVLGCFAEGTLVATDAGFVPIEEITQNHRIWDGVGFVGHSGVVFQGVKPVVDLGGVLVTPEHEILGEDGWARADSVDLKSAAHTASGLSSGMSSTGKRWQLECGAGVVLKGLCRFTICAEEHRRRVVGAPMRPRTKFCGIARASQRLFRTQLYASAGLTGALRLSRGAMIRRTPISNTTAAEASRCANHGERTLERSCSGSCCSPGGRTRNSSWIDATTTARTRRVTAGSPHARSSSLTDETMCESCGPARTYARRSSIESIARDTGTEAPCCGNCDSGTPRKASSLRKTVAEARTYDVLNCGPRSRFAVLTLEGLVIAHNCLFGQGWRGLIKYAEGYGVRLTDDRSQEIVKLYRDEYRHVRDLWWGCGDASIEATRNPGVWVKAGEKLSLIHHKGFLWMKLPNGRHICWARPLVEYKRAPWMEKFWVGYDEEGNDIYGERPAFKHVVTVESIDTKTRQFCRHPLIGSSIFQSAVQGSARDILAEGTMFAENAGYQAVLLAHDENLSLVREGWGDPDEFGELLITRTHWRKDLPLAYEAWRGKRFRK